MSLSQRFSDIADAIRAKAGTQATMTPAEMPTAIANIPSGGGGTDYLKQRITNTLTSYTIPNDVAELVAYSFANLSNLTSITFPSNLRKIGSSAFQGTGFVSIDIPSTINIFGGIGDMSFYQCTNLTTVYIRGQVSSTSIALLSYAAFRWCSSLTAFHMSSTIVPTLSTTSVFMNTPIASGSGYIYVPYSADHSILNAYKAANNWSTFADQIVEEPQA